MLSHIFVVIKVHEISFLEGLIRFGANYFLHFGAFYWLSSNSVKSISTLRAATTEERRGRQLWKKRPEDAFLRVHRGYPTFWSRWIHFPTCELRMPFGPS